MGDGVSLIDIGKLAEPAKVLIEKISDAVGGIAKPGQIRRVAKAEADAEIIKAKARIEITQIEERALARLVAEEARKQENIEKISYLATEHLTETAQPDKIDNDWLTHFFDKSRQTSDEEMQSLWAKLLGGEANRPGTFSRRTIDLVSTFSKRDAELFTRFCGFVWLVGPLTPIIPNLKHEHFKKAGMTFDSLSHLEDIGLIKFDPQFSFGWETPNSELTVHYYGWPVQLHPTDSRIYVGCASLTAAGSELARIAGSRRNLPYFHYVLSDWESKKILTACPIDSESFWRNFNEID